MYRIRFHGRGGQGMKTAGRILGTALFRAGFEVQDAPRYGAERRGAPISAYVRASTEPIKERGIIVNPDLAIVADDTLVPIPTAAVTQGLIDDAVLLIVSEHAADEWQRRLNFSGKTIVLPPTPPARTPELPTVGARCVGAAARLIGHVGRDRLETAVVEELSPMGPAAVEENLSIALLAFDSMAGFEGIVREGYAIDAGSYRRPEWADIPSEDVSLSGPAIYAGATSIEVRTGLWRILRPVVDYELCRRCNWICGSFCPDSAIRVAPDGRPLIDYDHCKGCMICVAQCPPHAISVVPEADALSKGDAR